MSGDVKEWQMNRGTLAGPGERQSLSAEEPHGSAVFRVATPRVHKGFTPVKIHAEMFEFINFLLR